MTQGMRMGHLPRKLAEERIEPSVDGPELCDNSAEPSLDCVSVPSTCSAAQPRLASRPWETIHPCCLFVIISSRNTQALALTVATHDAITPTLARTRHHRTHPPHDSRNRRQPALPPSAASPAAVGAGGSGLGRARRSRGEGQARGGGAGKRGSVLGQRFRSLLRNPCAPTRSLSRGARAAGHAGRRGGGRGGRRGRTLKRGLGAPDPPSCRAELRLQLPQPRLWRLPLPPAAPLVPPAASFFLALRLLPFPDPPPSRSVLAAQCRLAAHAAGAAERR